MATSLNAQPGEGETDPFAPSPRAPNQAGRSSGDATAPVERGSRGEEDVDKESYWQQYVATYEPLDLSQRITNLFGSMVAYHGVGEIHLIHRPGLGTARVLFVHDEKDMLSVTATHESVFRHSNNVIYFAHYGHIECGRSVAAYDLATGSTLWHTTLKNQYTARWGGQGLFTMFLWKDGIVVAGRETNGDYVEILDQKSGKSLAYRVFLPEVPKVQPPGPFPDDRRLDVKVTYQYPNATTLAQIYEDLSKQTGVPLSVAPEFDQGEMTTAERTESLRAVMRRWSESIHPSRKWIRDRDGYRLIVEPKKE